jgi:hypothetical protein
LANNAIVAASSTIHSQSYPIKVLSTEQKSQKFPLNKGDIVD